MLQRNETGEWYCTSCGKLVLEHTREEIRTCAPEEILTDNESGFSYNMTDVTVRFNPEARKHKRER